MHCLRKCVLNPDVTAKWFGIKHLFDLAKDVVSFCDLIEAQPELHDKVVQMWSLARSTSLVNILLSVTNHMYGRTFWAGAEAEALGCLAYYVKA